MNKEELTQFRKDKVQKYVDTANLITDNWLEICVLAEKFQKEKESFRIETPFGEFTFVPNYTFAYKDK